MVEYTPGDWDLLVRAARQQAEKRLNDAVHAVEGYAVILDQAGQQANALDAQKLLRTLIAARVRLDEIGGDRG